MVPAETHSSRLRRLYVLAYLYTALVEMGVVDDGDIAVAEVHYLVGSHWTSGRVAVARE